MLFSAVVSAALAVAPLDLGAGCKAAKQEVGSIHAKTSHEVQMEVPKAKHTQPLECDGKLVTLYVSEYATAESLGLAASLTGGQLWGSQGPSARHPDQLLVKGTVLVVASGPGHPAATKALTALGFGPYQPPVADAVDRVAAALDCGEKSTDPLRAWCGAALTKGAGFTAPKGKVTYVGLSVPLNPKFDVRDVMLKATTLARATFADGKFTLSNITPDNEGEKKLLLEVAGQVAAVLKGKSKDVKVGKDLAGFLDSLAADAAKTGAAVKDSAKGPATAKLALPARLWRVKANGVDVIVVAEEARDGTFVNVYPVVPYTP